MKSERAFPKVSITQKAARSLKNGHPWVYIDEIIFEDLEKLNHASKAESANIRNIVQEIVTTYHPNINDAEQHSAEHVRELQRVAAKINATD